MIKHCIVCKKEIKVPNCLIKRKKYCSKKCLYSATKKRMKNNILWKKTISTQFKKGHKFIGPIGINHPNWKGGGATSKAWIEWTTTIKKRDNWTCQHCGYKGKKGSKYIISHHKIHYKLAPELKFDVKNGITLCKKCHPLYHPELAKNLV